MDAIPAEAANLMAQLLEQSMAETQRVTNALMDSYKATAQTEMARVAAIRDAVQGLFAGPFAPSESAVMKALWPSEDDVDAHRDPDHV